MPRFPTRQKSAFAAVLLAGSILAGGLVPAAASAQTTDTSPASPPVVAQAGFSELVKKVKPAVVNIATLEMSRQTDMRDMPQFPPDSPFADMFKQFMERRNARPEHALGSGFVIDPTGYIVTNNHVVDGAHKITVTTDDGTSYPAKVVGHDAKTDLALIKVEAKKPLPFVTFGDSDQEQVGDWVIAVGNPFGLGGSVTAGIVSAHGRNINEGPYDDFLQIDAPINPGNSGGPLFNQSGQVIGIDTAIYSPNGGSVGIGFAIPSRIAAKVVTALREHGEVERGWLGVQMQPLTPNLAKAVGRRLESGVIVSDVLADSPAQHAGLKQGDVITGYDGKPIKDTRDLALAVAETPSGKTIPVSVWRDGHDQTVDVRIGTQSKEQMAADDGDGQPGPVGMALESLSKEARSELGLNTSAKGVVVAQVEPGSRADESGIQPGDVIVRIGDTSVTTPNQAAQKIKEAESAKKEAVPLLVTRNGTTYYIALQLTQG